MKGSLAVALLIVAGCSAPAASPSAPPTASPKPVVHLLTGSLELQDPDGWTYGAGDNDCFGDGGYSDIDEGADVTVKNQDGSIIATGRLEAGRITNQGVNCTFNFSVAGIPDATFYSVEVSHRGELRYSKAELEQQNWTVTFTLGS